MTETIKQTIPKCPRCGKLHIDVIFKPLTNTNNKFWALCYDTQEPIISEITDMEPKVRTTVRNKKEREFINEVKNNNNKCVVCGEETKKKTKYCSDSCRKKYTKYKKFLTRTLTSLKIKEFIEITKDCDICGQKTHIRLIFKDGNSQNTNRDNIEALCPKCHVKRYGVFNSANGELGNSANGKN